MNGSSHSSSWRSQFKIDACKAAEHCGRGAAFGSARIASAYKLDFLSYMLMLMRFEDDDDNDKTDAGDNKGDDVDNDNDNVQLLLLLSSFPSFESCSFAQVPIDDLSRSNWQKPLKVCGASQR